MSRRRSPAPPHARVELLLSKQVHDVHGQRIGRIEAIRALRRGDHCEVESYLLGAYGALERLASGRLFRSAVRRLYPRARTGYAVSWKKMDLSDTDHPRTTCARE
jgi:hypothetical protein